MLLHEDTKISNNNKLIFNQEYLTSVKPVRNILEPMLPWILTAITESHLIKSKLKIINPRYYDEK